MDIIKLIIQILAAVSGCLAALMSITLFLRVRWPAPALWSLKLFVSALSPWLFLIGVVSTIAGLTTGSDFISTIGIYVAVVFLIHILRVTRPPDSSNGFEFAFGSQWEDRINPQQEKFFLPSRRILRLPIVPNPRMEIN